MAMPPGAVVVDLVPLIESAEDGAWCPWCDAPTARDVDVLVARHDNLLVIGRARIRCCVQCSADAHESEAPSRVS